MALGFLGWKEPWLLGHILHGLKMFSERGVSFVSGKKGTQLLDAGAGGADCIGWLGLYSKAWGTAPGVWQGPRQLWERR